MLSPGAHHAYEPDLIPLRVAHSEDLVFHHPLPGRHLLHSPGGRIDPSPFFGCRSLFRHESSMFLLTLTPLEAVGFLLHRERPAVAGLTLAPQAFYLSVCPTARNILIPSSLMFLAALWSRSWQVRQAGHSQIRSLSDSS